jgi:hypothetical protein
MPKSANSVQSKQFRITISEQSEDLLEQLAEKGIYGRNAAEVAGRFVDQALREFVEKPTLKVRTRGTKGERK